MAEGTQCFTLMMFEVERSFLPKKMSCFLIAHDHEAEHNVLLEKLNQIIQ